MANVAAALGGLDMCLGSKSVLKIVRQHLDSKISYYGVHPVEPRTLILSAKPWVSLLSTLMATGLSLTVPNKTSEPPGPRSVLSMIMFSRSSAGRSPSLRGSERLISHMWVHGYQIMDIFFFFSRDQRMCNLTTDSQPSCSADVRFLCK